MNNKNNAVALNQGGHVKGLSLNPGILARHHWGSRCHERSPGDRQKLGNVCLVKRHHWPSSSMYRFTTFIKLHRDQYIDRRGNTHLNDTFQGQTDFEEKPSLVHGSAPNICSSDLVLDPIFLFCFCIKNTNIWHSESRKYTCTEK